MVLHKVTLFVMGFKGLSTLNSLVHNKFEKSIDFVVVGRDKNVINDYADDIELVCSENNIPCYNRNEEYLVESKFAIAISWRWLIKLLDTQLIVFHESLLPKYRGFAPLVNQLLNKENFVGVTALFASEKYDRGNVILQSKIEVNYPIKIQEAIEQVSGFYSKIALEIFGYFLKNEELPQKKQEESEATYSIWRNEDDYRIDWNKSSESILHQVNVLGYPYAGASSKLKDRLVRIHEVEVVDDIVMEHRHCGKVVFIEQGFPIVICGEGLIKIKKATIEINGENTNLLPLKSFRSKFL